MIKDLDDCFIWALNVTGLLCLLMVFPSSSNSSSTVADTFWCTHKTTSAIICFVFFFVLGLLNVKLNKKSDTHRG